jgi:hypothetical protein
MAGRGRYDGLEVATVLIPDGQGGEREVRYLRRRPAPLPPVLPALARHRVAEGDRLDLVSARYLGDPVAFWRIADANEALNPDDLVAPEAAGNVLLITMPGI